MNLLNYVLLFNCAPKVKLSMSRPQIDIICRKRNTFVTGSKISNMADGWIILWSIINLNILIRTTTSSLWTFKSGLNDMINKYCDWYIKYFMLIVLLDANDSRIKKYQTENLDKYH